MNKKKSKILKFIFVIQVVIIVLIIYCFINIMKWVLDNKLNNEINNELAELITVEKSEEVNGGANDNIEALKNEEKDFFPGVEAENQEAESYSNSNANMNSNSDSNVSYKVDFEKIKEINSDAVGFLKVNGTNVEYIVVQGKDNEYYLTHNLKKEKNKAGWIYVDYKNQIDGNDKNLVIYGHNRRNGTMFSSLKNVLNKEWYNKEENRKIIFLNEEEQFVYEVFSIYQIKVEDYYAKTNFKTEEEWMEFINKIKARSIKDFGISVGKEDNILTLSTCSNNNAYRIVLHAVKK